MAQLSSLWTLALFPLCLFGAIFALVAFAESLWLLCGTLSVAVFFAVYRLVGSARTYSYQKEAEEADAQIWDGKETAVGLGSSIHGLLLIALCATGVAAVFISLFPRAWQPWCGFALGLGCCALSVCVIGRAPDTLLRISQQGIWDERFGWIAWRNVQAVDLQEFRIRSTRIASLIVRVDAHLQESLRRAAKRRVSLPIARLQSSGNRIEYQISNAAIHPLRALTVARGWLTYAREGYKPEPVLPLEQRGQALAALDRTQRSMVLASRVVGMSLALAPFALAGDLWIRWGK